MIFTDSELSLAFLRDQKTSQTCTRIFNMLWTLAGPDLFRESLGWRTPYDVFVDKHGEEGKEFLAKRG